MKKTLLFLAAIICLVAACEKEPVAPEPAAPEPVVPAIDSVAATGVVLDKSRDTLLLGDTLFLKAVVKPDSATCKDVIWTSRKPEVASVDSTGAVVGLKTGSALIVATTVDGGYFAACLVKVSKGKYSGLNRHYDVYVQTGDGKWESIKVTDALCSDISKHSSIWNDWNNSRKLRDTMAYCIFEHEFTGPVKVRVRKNTKTFSRAEVRPTAYRIQVTDIGDNTIEFTLPSVDCGKVSVEFDSDRQHNLFLFGYRPDTEKPDTSSPKVKYYGPGEHNVGYISLQEGETLYIDYGATVYATVEVSGSNTTIAGHGVLSGARSAHKGDIYSTGSMLLRVNTAGSGKTVRNFRINGVTLIDSPSWTLCLYVCAKFIIEDVNIISWILNGDGIDIVSCQDGTISKCFIRTYDDSIGLKMNGEYYPVHDVANLEICNNIIYNDIARGVSIGPECGSDSYNTGTIHGINVHDCHFLQDAGSSSLTRDVMGCLVIYQKYGPNWEGTSKSTARDVYDITARNLYFDNISKTGRNIVIYQDDYMVSTCKLKNLLFENIYVSDYNGCTNPIFYINTNQHSIEDLTIRNYYYEGRKVLQTDNKLLVVTGNVTPVIE